MVRIDAKVNERPFPIASLQAKIIEYDADRMYELLEDFAWEYEKRDLHHWIPLLNHFDDYLEKVLYKRTDIDLRDLSKPESDTEFPKRNVLSILTTTCTLLRTCLHKQLYNSLEAVSLLLGHPDIEISETAMDVMLEYATKKGSMNLSTSLQTWTQRLRSIVMVSCRTQAIGLKAFVSDANDVKLDELCPLSTVWPADFLSQRPSRKGVVACDMGPARDVSTTDREATRRIVQARGVDPASTTAADMNLKFHVLVAVRSHRRCQETAYRHFVLRMRMKAMYAFIASSKSSGLRLLAALKRSEPHLLEEVQELILDVRGTPLSVRRAALFGIAALATMHRQARSPALHKLLHSGPSCFFAMILDQVVKWMVVQGGDTDSSMTAGLEEPPKPDESAQTSATGGSDGPHPFDVPYVEAFTSVLHNLITLFTAPPSSSNPPAEAWVIPSLLTGLEARAPQFYNAAITMLKMLDVYFEVSGPACTLFLEQRGCAKVLELCARIQVDAESVVEAASTMHDCSFPPTDTGVVPARLRNLMKAAVNVYFQARYSQGHEGGAEEADFLALSRICSKIMLNARHYGGPLLHTFMRVILDMIHTEPTHFAVCFDGGMPAAFVQMLRDGVLPDANVVSSVPMMLEAFCLHEKGRALITEHAPLRALVPLLSHRAYCTPDSAGVAPMQLPDFSSGLEELVRHMPPTLSHHAVDAVLAALRVLCAVGGDEEALRCRVGKPVDEPKPAQDAPGGGADAAPGASEPAAATDVNEGQDANHMVVLSPGRPDVQQGWLPGIGASGVVKEWSHWEAKPQKLETMLNNAVHILDMMMTLSSSHVGIKALDEKGCFDLLLRLHNMPRMPPALILERNVRASLLPTQVLRASQVSIVTRIAPLTMEAFNKHVQHALEQMKAVSSAAAQGTSKLVVSSLPYEATESVASAVARAVSTLALATELVRLLPSVLEQLTVPNSDGQSVMSKITRFDLAVKAMHTSSHEWLDSADAKAAINSQQAKVDAERGWMAALPGTVKPDVAAKVGATLARVSPKEPRTSAAKTSTTAPLLQLPALLQNAEHNVRLFHAAVCKCVHHPTTRYRRGGSSPATPAVDAVTGCIITPHTRRALAFLAQGRAYALDSAADACPTGDLEKSDPRTLIRAMQRLAVCGEDTRVCLFEMRRKEYYSLMISYLHGVGGFQALARRFSDAIAVACVVLRKAAKAKAAEPKATSSKAADGTSGGTAQTQKPAPTDGAADDAAAAPGPPDGAAMDAEDTPAAPASGSGGAAAGASRPVGATSTAKSWSDAAAVAAPMLSTFLTLFSLLLHQRSLMQQPSAVLMGHALPDLDSSGAPEPARPAAEVVHEIQGIALGAVLQLWEALSAGAAVAPGVPPALLSHLVSTLSVAYASKADKTNSPPAGGRGNTTALDAAAAMGVRAGSPWGPARNLVRPAFVPSESSISALSDGMGFPRDQVEFVMNRISSNEVPLLANYFLEHDVESMMRAGQAASGAGEAGIGRAASTMSRPRGNGAGDASASGETTPAPPPASAEDGQGDAAEKPASSSSPQDMLAEALADSRKRAKGTAQQQKGDGAAPSVPNPTLPTVADLGAGAMRLCLQNPGHVFLLAQLFQQATHAAPESAKDWIAAELTSLLAAGQAKPGAAGTSKAVLTGAATVDDDRRRQVFMHLILVCCTKSSLFARHFAAKSDVMMMLCDAAIKKVEEIAATPVADSTESASKTKPSISGIPPWVNCVMGIAVAIARLQPEKAKAEGSRAPASAEARSLLLRQAQAIAHQLHHGSRALGSLSERANDIQGAAERQGQGAAEEAQEAGSPVNRVFHAGSQRSHMRANARRRLYAQLANADRQAAGEGEAAAAAEAEGAATDAASAEAMVTDEGTGGGGDEATGAHKRDRMHSRLNQIFTGNWRPCGLLSDGDQSRLTKLCCEVVTTLRKHGQHMPTPTLESLNETKIHSSDHPRGALISALQLMAQLGRWWPNAQAMVSAGMPRCLMAMPAPALCTGALGDITRVLCLLVEDRDVNLPAVMDISVCSLFNKVARAEYGRSGSARTPTLQMRAFISAATSANFIDRDPLQFVHAISRNCKYAPGDTTSIQLQPALAGVEPATPAASIVPAKRNGDGSIKARGTSSTVSAAVAPTAAADPAPASAAAAAEQPLPPEVVQTIQAVVQRLTEAYKACKRQVNRPPRPVAVADYKRRILENAWSLAPSHEAPFMLALSLHSLLNFILRYPKALAVIMAESAGLSAAPATPEGSLDAHPLLGLIFGALPPVIWGMHGLSSIYSHFLLATIVRIACALHMRSTQHSSQIITMAMSQMRGYIGSLEANFKPTAETLVALATKHTAFLPAGEAMASHRLQLFASILFHLTADGTRCPALSQSAVTLVRSAGGVQVLPLALEAVNYARKEGRMAAVVLLAVLSRLLRAGQATLPTRIAGFARQLMRAGRAAASAGDFQESQRALRLAGSLPAFERWTAAGGRLDAGTSGAQQPTPSPTELSAAVLTAISVAANDLTSLHPAMAHLIAGGPTAQGNGDGARGPALSDMIQSLRYGVGGGDAAQATPLSGLRELFPTLVDDAAAGEGRDGDAGEMDAALDGQLDDAVDADFEEHREYMDSVLEDADQDDDEVVDVPQYDDEGMNNAAAGHRGEGDSSEDEMHGGNDEDDDEDDDDESDGGGEGDVAAAEANGDHDGEAVGGGYAAPHSSDDEGSDDIPEQLVDYAMLGPDGAGMGGHDVLPPGGGDEMDLEEAQAQLADMQADMHAAAQELQDQVGGGAVADAAVDGDEEMAMEETEAMIAEMEADMHANGGGDFHELAFQVPDDELEEEDAEMAAAHEEHVQAAQHMADINAGDEGHDAPFLEDFDIGEIGEHPMALDGMPLHTFPGLGVPSSNEIAAAIGSGGRFFFNGLNGGGDRGGDGAGGDRGGAGGTPAIRDRSHFMRLLTNSQFSFEVADGDAQGLTGMEIFDGLGTGLFSRARMQIRVSPLDPRSAGSRAEFARFVTEGLRGASGGTTVAGQLMSRLFDGGMGLGNGPFTASVASDPAAALLAVGPIPALPLFPGSSTTDGSGSTPAGGGSSHMSHAMRSLYSGGLRSLQSVPTGEGTISSEVQRLLLLERMPPDVPSAGSRGSTGTSVLLLSPSGNSAASAVSNAAQAAALTASVLPYSDIGTRSDGHQAEARSGTGALVRTSALTRSLLHDALAHVPAGVGVGAGPGAPEVSVSQRRFHDMMYGHARHPEHPLTTRQVGGSSVMEAAIAEVMTAEDNEAASGDRATQDPSRRRDPRLLPLFSPRARQIAGDQDMDRSIFDAIQILHRHSDRVPPDLTASFTQAARVLDGGAEPSRPDSQSIIRALQHLVNAMPGPGDHAPGAAPADGEAGATADAGTGSAAARARGEPSARPEAEGNLFRLLRLTGATGVTDAASQSISVLMNSVGAASGAAGAQAPAPQAAATAAAPSTAAGGDTDMADATEDPPPAAAEARQDDVSDPPAAAPDEGHAPMDGVREQAAAVGTAGAAPAELPVPAVSEPAQPSAPDSSAAVTGAAAETTPAAAAPVQGSDAAAQSAEVRTDDAEAAQAATPAPAAAPASAPESAAGGAAPTTGDAVAPPAEAEEGAGNGVLTARMRERATAAGLDVSMLEALPPDMVRETLLAYGVNIRDSGGGASEAAAAAEDTRAALEGVIPPELLNEGLQAERDRAARRLREFSGARQRAAAGDMAAPGDQAANDGAAAAPGSGAAQDFATMIMSFPTDVREDALASLPADVIEQLPATLRSQAQRVQGRRGVPGRLRETMGNHLGRIAGVGGAAGQRANRDVSRGDGAALSSLLSGTLDRMPARLTDLPDTAPCDELGADSVRTLIKLNACAAVLESESSVISSSSRPDIHDGVTAILVGCLPTSQSVARVCSLFMAAVSSFLVQPRAVAPPSSAPVRRLVLGLDMSRAAMCPQANDAALVLTGLLGMLSDLSRFDGHVAQGLMESNVPEEDSGKRSKASEEGTPAVLCLMQLLQSDIGTVSPIARSAILSLLESLLTSVATQHISETYRRPPASSLREVTAMEAAAAAPAPSAAEPAADVDMERHERQSGAGTADAAPSEAAPATAAPASEAATSAAAPTPGSGPVTRRRRRLNSGDDAPVSDAAAPDGAAAPSSGAGPSTDAGPSDGQPTAASADAAPRAQKLLGLDASIITPVSPRPSVAVLRSLPTAPVVLFTQSLAYKIPNRASMPPSKAPAQVSMYDVSAAQKVRRTLVLLCQLSPLLIEPVFDAVATVFQNVRGGLQGAVHQKAAGGESTSADAEAATASAELSASAITQISSSARVLLEIVATLRTLLVVLQSYTHFSGLVQGAVTAAQAVHVAEDGTVPAAERARILAGMEIGEVQALPERKVTHASFAEDVAAGHIARVHSEAHCQLLSHLKRQSESAKADAAAAEAGKSNKPAAAGPSTGGTEAQTGGSGAAAPAAGSSGASTSKAAAAEERRQSERMLWIPPAIDAEVQSGPLPQANTLIAKLHDLLDSGDLWESVSARLSAAEGSLPKAPANPANRTTRTPLPAVLSALQPLVECYFALCSVCGLLGAPPQPPSFDTVTPMDVEGQTAVHAALPQPESPRATQDAPPAFSQADKSGSGSCASSSPQRFMERHRACLNAYLAHDPKLLEGAFAFLLNSPRLIDFANKVAYFRAKVTELKGRERMPPVSIAIHRARAFEESFRQLKPKPASEMRGPLQVRFHGEEGIDMGGLTREWYEVMAKAICDPNLALFASQPELAQTYQPSKNAVIQDESMVSFRDYFRFCGRFVGKALLDGQQLSCYFTRSFYKHMLAVPLTLKDLEHVDPDYYKSLQYLLEHDVEEALPDTPFVTEVDFFGRKDLVELKPGGANIMVTNENKQEYANLAARQKMTTSIKEPIEAFQAGLWEVVPLSLLRLLSHAELELMLSGLPDIDVHDLRRNTAYAGGLSATDRLVQWFWAIVEDMDKQDVALLLQFVTGTSKVPLGGFGQLFGIAGEQKFTIQKGNGGPDRLPTAHTCFNQLDLHKYESKEQLRDRLMIAIHEGATGFGFA